jgi:hypothetical protein
VRRGRKGVKQVKDAGSEAMDKAKAALAEAAVARWTSALTKKDR